MEGINSLSLYVSGLCESTEISFTIFIIHYVN